jgi:hypothetical protein
MTVTLPNSYNTQSIYNTVPQFIQDQDAQNGYALWYFIYGAASQLDQLDILTRNNVGQGIHVEGNFGVYATYLITDAQIANPIAPGDTTITIFNTDSTWYVFPSTSPILLELVNSLTGVIETISVPAGYYDWNAPVITLTNVTRNYPTGGVGLSWPASSGADGSVYLQDWAGAPGWSQAVDIQRCPNYALPWLAQFVGASIPADTTMSRQQIVQTINSLGGFNRATAEAITQQLIQVINSQLVQSVSPLSESQVIIMENTQTTSYTVTGASANGTTVTYTCSNSLVTGQVVTISGLATTAFNLTNVIVASATATQFTVTNSATGTTVTSQQGTCSLKEPYSYSFSAMTILLPSIYFSSQSYQTLTADAGGSSSTYTSLQSYLSSIGGLYFDLQGSTVASNNSPYVNFIYRYRPAGMQIFVGGY